jgi:two-component system, NarL family, sensor histidine kinase UhpB
MSSLPDVPEDSVAADAASASFVRQLSQRVEYERRRIVGELHDVIGAALVGARLKAFAIEQQACDGTVPREEVARLAGELVAGLTDIYTATRGLIQRLRPETLDVCGLGAALAELVRSYQTSGSSCSFSFAQDTGMPKITGEPATQGYRLVQEALTNAVKHSQASYVTVFARCEEGQLTLSVRDDGVGFDVHRASRGIGLSYMRERVASMGGRMEIHSSAEDGTTLLFTLPVESAG